MTNKLLLSPCLSLLVLCAAGPAQRKGTDQLGTTFTRWFRDYRAGKIEADDVWGPQSQPYLDPPPQQLARRRASRGRGRPRYSRLAEAAELFRRLVDRGRTEDGDRLLRVVATSFRKKGGRFWELTGDYTRFRRAALRAMASPRCPTAIQAAVAARIEAGFAPAGRKGGPAGDDIEAQQGSDAVQHAEPELATALIPLVADFARPEYREVLQKSLRVDHPGMKIAAAAALARMGFGPSITAVAEAVAAAKYPDDVARLATSVAALVRASHPAAGDHDLEYALGLVQQRVLEVRDWRARIALVPVLRTIRSRSSIPVLIELLQETRAHLGKTGGAGRVASGTLLHAVHDALVDLTGFYVDARDPERWRTWWDEVKDRFVLPKERRSAGGEARNGTVASTFFGIPVTGNHVVFVFDVSGSMGRPYEAVTVPGRAGGGRGGVESKLDRAKKELRRALAGVTPDAKFNVIFFSDDTTQWKTRLVPATRKHKKALDAFLAKYRGQGATALYDGLEAAMKIKVAKRRSGPYGSAVDEVFLLSDGLPTRGRIQDPQEILDLVTKWNAGAQVRIHTIYIANPRARAAAGSRAQQFMRRLAAQNHGKFVVPNRGG